jgi:DNA-binding NarL/FixJ family response regulator
MSENSVTEAGQAQPRISVFLLDDHEIVRLGVRDLLAAEPDIDVVGEAGTMASALQRMPSLRPDVAVLDVRLPDGDGVSVCREIRSTLPGTACLMLTSYGDDHALLGAIMAGAAGYVLKQTCGSDLVSAVRTVAAGQSTLDAHAARRVMERLRERMASVDPLSALTEQEKRVLDLIGEGLTNRQIAERMFLAEKTAKNYVSSLLTKLGMQRRAQAAAFAARLAEHRDDLEASPRGLPGSRRAEGAPTSRVSALSPGPQTACGPGGAQMPRRAHDCHHHQLCALRPSADRTKGCR